MLTCFFGCQNDRTGSSSATEVRILPSLSIDPHSYARPAEATVNHLDLDLHVDFDKHILEGEATWVIENRKNAPEIIFDTRDLEITEVRTGADEQMVDFTLDSSDKILGQALHIPLTPETEMVTIRYRTSPDAEALQWLTPEQSGTRTTPFLYTQSEPILARTWFPCQDSPGVRFTYTARITTPHQVMALMSAENPTNRNASGEYLFRMNQPVASYMVALAVGELEFIPTGPRTGIYARPDILPSAAEEFSQLEDLVSRAERFFGPYLWDRYDLLIMPSAFPLGGMENPRLNFISPTALSGDGSMMDLVAHELSHAWAGNLATNGTWCDFWLNEGLATYLHRRIMKDLRGREYADMAAEWGYERLLDALKEKGANDPDTRLRTELEGRDPAEGMGAIAYEKGYLFLTALGDATADYKVDNLLNAWFRKADFEAVQSADFLTFLREKLVDTSIVRFNPDLWVYGTGLPARHPVPDAQGFRFVDRQLEALTKEKVVTAVDTAEWTVYSWIYFIRHLPADANMDALDRRFGLTGSSNAEIQSAWFEQAARHNYVLQVRQPMEAFLIRTGRLRYTRGIYEALLAHDQKDMAREIYQQARPGYHALTRKVLDRLFS